VRAISRFGFSAREARLIVNIVAYGIGAPLIGKISDLLGVATSPDQMRLSLLVCPVACAMGALLLWMGSRARTARNPRSAGDARSAGGLGGWTACAEHVR
jgi:hypothetical protein